MAASLPGRRASLAALLVVLATISVQVDAHIAAWNPGMYCMNGTTEHYDPINNNVPVAPLVDLEYEDWWMQHGRGCDVMPPNDGDFLDLPAGGSFVADLAGNLAFSHVRKFPPPQLRRFGDGDNHRIPYDIHHGAPLSPEGCIGSPNLHTQNESAAYGSAFAISYNSNISDVTMDNLVVFTVRKNTPFYRLARFDVPEDLPPCPEGGCHCTWLWVADGCGQDNMYMQPMKCKVLGSKSKKTLARAQTPRYCKDDPTLCVKGAKSMIAWKQKSGNNYVQRDGEHRPGYNDKLGFADGAQNDIFEDSPSSPSSTDIGSIAEGFLNFTTGYTRKRRLLVFQ